MKLELLLDARAQLGEGPAWHAREQTLYWVDILGKCIYAGDNLRLELENFPACIAPRKTGGLIIGLGTSLVELDPATGEISTRAVLEEPENNRINDGKCDPAGRFLVGTMDQYERLPNGSLYTLERRTARKLLSGTRISNGMTWSPDYKTFYYIDTPTHAVQAFDYDLASGEIGNGRTAIQIPETLGWPDGMTSDTDGNLWIAMWGGAQVIQWNASTGELLERIPVPALNTSSCIFGGANMNELYITSARSGMNPRELAEYPLSGGLFRVSTRVTGTPTFEFAW